LLYVNIKFIKLDKLKVYGDEMSKVSAVKRIKKIMQERKISQVEIAKAANVTPQAITRWFKTESISTQSLMAVAKYLNVDIEWLISGEETRYKTYQKNNTGIREGNAAYAAPIEAWDESMPLGKGEVAVPFYSEVELSAKSGSRSEIKIDVNGPKLHFQKSSLQKHGVQIEHAACVKVSGNSMEPVIPDGATVGIDTSKTEIKDGDMYAIDWDGALFIKILYRRPSGAIRIRSFNSDEYQDEELSLQEAQSIRVIGRLFWYSVLR